MLCLGVTLYVGGRRLGVPMPYRLLYYLFPGFKSIRTPARMFVLVLLALSVLAGFGVKWIRESLRGRGRALAGVVVAVVLVAALAVEMMPAAIHGRALPRREEFPPVYGWLATLEGDVSTVVLPLPRSDSPDTVDKQSYFQLEPPRLYYNTANWKDMVNGYSGYLPFSYYEAAYATRDFPSDESVEFLRRMKVMYVVMDGTRYSHTTRFFALNRPRKDRRFKLVKKFDRTYVFSLF